MREIQFREDVFNAEDAKVGAEERKGGLLLCDLCENLCVLCVDSGALQVACGWPRGAIALYLRFEGLF